MGLEMKSSCTPSSIVLTILDIDRYKHILKDKTMKKKIQSIKIFQYMKGYFRGKKVYKH